MHFATRIKMKRVTAVLCAATLASSMSVPAFALADESSADGSTASASATYAAAGASAEAAGGEGVANGPADGDASGASSDAAPGLVVASVTDPDQMADSVAAIGDTDANLAPSNDSASAASANALMSMLFTEDAITGTDVAIAGESQYDTAAEEAQYAFSSADTAIIANGVSAVDALSATSLAGAYDCPILLTGADDLPQVTIDTLQKLGVSRVFVVGGTSAVSDDVASQLQDAVGSEPIRLGGEDIIGTQLAIYDYGVENGLWSNQVIVAQGVFSIADPTSVSSLAFSQKMPVFLANADGQLEDRSIERLSAASDVTRVIVVGGTSAVTDEAQEAAVDAVSSASGADCETVRLGGPLLYDTSSEIAKWAVSEGYLNWDNAAFTTGIHPTDALAGSAVQAHDSSVMLLVDDDYYQTIEAARESGATFSQIKFLGGPMAVSEDTRARARTLLGYSYGSDDVSGTSYYSVGMTLSDFAAYEARTTGQSASSITASANPTNYEAGTSRYLQFADLSQGYSGKVTAEELDDYIAQMCVYSERSYGVKSNMRGLGATIIEAAQKYNVNEVYLMAHAAIESAWGCSQLSQGSYINFFGIAAYDDAPEMGAEEAANNGWSTPERAMLGGAEWISDNFINSGSSHSGNQNTLWKMRWDTQAASASSWLHQYATDLNWATNIARTMGSFYSVEGIALDDAGLDYEIPQFE